MKNLDELRTEINAIDKEMAALFEKRMEVAKNVALYKKENNLPVFDAKREETLKQKNLSLIKDERLKEYYLEVFEKMLEVSKKMQEEILKESK